MRGRFRLVGNLDEAEGRGGGDEGKPSPVRAELRSGREGCGACAAEPGRLQNPKMKVKLKGEGSGDAADPWPVRVKLGARVPGVRGRPTADKPGG